MDDARSDGLVGELVYYDECAQSLVLDIRTNGTERRNSH